MIGFEDNWDFVIAGYLLVFLTLALYSFYIMRKASRLAARVPKSKRRYLD